MTTTTMKDFTILSKIGKWFYEVVGEIIAEKSLNQSSFNQLGGNKIFIKTSAFNFDFVSLRNWGFLWSFQSSPQIWQDRVRTEKGNFFPIVLNSWLGPHGKAVWERKGKLD